ncbi:hypothetical protein [Blastococcus sp. TF02A-26]|uniref:hypothetical protein n=1 Tax=Blastococcus sp. TF02A-26 TaxID=2250577 RepID=UPI000DE973D9|nr:hypothetical protein [Blastococcus sp. TF02A-26]RBY86082.1 hypothetical protein DQ240_09695 [Blastococcus sp. TF02A-26]
MNPLRWEVLGLAFVLALPVLALGYRGDLTIDDMLARLPWCLAAAWAAVALLSAVARPRKEPGKPGRTPAATPAPESESESEPTPAP